MLGSIGPMELGIIALIALLLFGAGRIAAVGKGLGQSIRNFREEVKDGEPDPRKSET
jgi:sec-independent protein translocase protein TatA